VSLETEESEDSKTRLKSFVTEGTLAVSAYNVVNETDAVEDRQTNNGYIIESQPSPKLNPILRNKVQSCFYSDAPTMCCTK